MIAEHQREETAPDSSCRVRRMLNEQQLLQLIPISASTLYRLERSGKFPRSTYISENRRCWFEDEVVAWQTSINGRRRGRRVGAVSK
jgi:prophage regulatory protein